MNPVVVGLIWRMFLHPTLGIVNYLLGLVGLAPVNWLGDAPSRVLDVVMVDIWHQVSFMIVLLLAGLSALPARALRGSPRRRRQRAPCVLAHHAALMRPVIVVTLLIRLIFAVQDLRPHLHHDARRAGHVDRSRQLLHLPAGLRQPESRRGLRHVGDRADGVVMALTVYLHRSMRSLT